MTSKETFTHYQPLGNSDPAHTATAPGGLSAKAPAMTPLMLDTSTRKLVAWDGTTDGACGGPFPRSYRGFLPARGPVLRVREPPHS